MKNKWAIILLSFEAVIFLAIFGVTAENIPQSQRQSDQKMEGFSLSNFGKNNEKEWDLFSDSLEVFGNVIEMTNVTAKLYGEEKMILTANSGIFDRQEGQVKLKDNVIITSSSGAKMTTDSLNWLQNKQLVFTEDKVKIVKDNIIAQGQGAEAKPDLKQFNLKNDVKVDIDQERKTEGKPKTITIVCDGPLDIDYLKQEAVFNRNVYANDGESELYSDKMTAYFDKDSKQLIEVVAEGNVKIIRGQDIAYSRKAIYNARTKKISLIGRPKLVFYSSGENVFSLGKEIENKTNSDKSDSDKSDKEDKIEYKEYKTDAITGD